MKVPPLATPPFIRASAAIVLALGFFATEAHTSVLLKVTFDNDGPTGSEPGVAADPYRVSTGPDGDIIGGSITAINRVGTDPSTPNVVTSTGPQGGLALSLAGTESSGYAVEGGYGITAVTYEVLVNVAETSGYQSIFRQANQAGTSLSFVSGQLVFNDIVYNYTPNLGEWVHLAATVVWDGTNAVSQLYLNGQLLGSNTRADSLTGQVFGTLNIGFNDKNNAYFMNGQIDAFAMSDTVLDPSNFVLPVPVPEPSALVLLAVGGVYVILVRIRQRSLQS